MVWTPVSRRKLCDHVYHVLFLGNTTKCISAQRLVDRHISFASKARRVLRRCLNSSPMTSVDNLNHLFLVPASRNMRTLFDFNLPEDLLDHILLMLSARPRHSYPMHFVQPRDVLVAMGSSKQLRNAALKKFNSIGYGLPFKADKDSPKLCVSGEDPSFLETLLDDFSGNLRKLSVFHSSIGHHWTDVLVCEARLITELALYGLGNEFPLPYRQSYPPQVVCAL